MKKLMICKPKTKAQWTLAFLAAAVIIAFAAYYRAYLWGVLPFLLLAACPLLHLFMHKDHGGHNGRWQQRTEDDSGKDNATKN